MSAPSISRPARSRLLLLRLVVTAAVAALLPATAWGNAAVSKAACPSGVAGTCVYYTGSGNEFDAYDFTADATYVYLTPVRLDDNPAMALGASMTPGSGCSAYAIPGSVRCTLPATAIVINAQGGDDWLAKHLNCDCMRVIADLGDGNDLLRGTSFADTVKGGPGNDFLASYQGNDVLDGGAGDDTFDPQLGADDIVGGPGYDTIIYYKSTAESVSVTLDDLANDGQPGESDNVHGDVEDITGGKGDDTLTGNALNNVLRGDLFYAPLGSVDGNDTIDGGGGSDSLFGEGGNDMLRARDGVADAVDCGPGTDQAIVDTIDTVRNCETVEASRQLEPDGDGDGIASPADCNDANAAINPRATDIAENGIDENCDGVDAVNFDRDADGYLRPQDCNDNDRTIKPGAIDKPGDGIDQDCNGKDAQYPELTATTTFLYSYNATTVVKRIDISRLKGGETATIRCTGRRCPFKIKTFKKLERGKRSFGRSLLRGRHLRPRSKLSVRVMKAGFVGTSTVLEVRRKKAPRITRRCLQPRATAPSRCP